MYINCVVILFFISEGMRPGVGGNSSDWQALRHDLIPVQVTRHAATCGGLN